MNKSFLLIGLMDFKSINKYNQNSTKKDNADIV